MMYRVAEWVSVVLTALVVPVAVAASVIYFF
jgi:hypothetical protein